MLVYSKEFFNKYEKESRKSAEQIVPIVMDLINPLSVVDVGCGVGNWLSVFRNNGVEEILGIDGDYVDSSQLKIPESHFYPFNLENPIKIDKKFDLVISLEVAEHLPSTCADTFVESLVNLGPIILFSAAVPNQGGVNHVNEQWPQYWVDRFKSHGYKVIDCIRYKIWDNRDVGGCYTQNTLIFIKQDVLKDYPKLLKEQIDTSHSILSIIHPVMYEWKVIQMNILENKIKKLQKRLDKKKLKKKNNKKK
ncbi:methyltransferase domain-containing protein [Cytobacillus firmus]|nr:methyltransferase domain-containing protein [Cytobacillus firmus]